MKDIKIYLFNVFMIVHGISKYLLFYSKKSDTTTKCSNILVDLRC